MGLYAGYDLKQSNHKSTSFCRKLKIFLLHNDVTSNKYFIFAKNIEYGTGIDDSPYGLKLKGYI